MSAEDHYFQFPLCALALDSQIRERLEVIISYGFIDAGRAIFDKLTPALRQTRMDDAMSHPDLPSDFRKTDRTHIAGMLGALAIGIRAGSMLWAVRRYNYLSEWLTNCQTHHGPDVQVRIEKKLAFEARDDAISYREFSVLCAIYSAIGAKQYPVRITRETIRCRSLGYKSPVMMAAIGPNRTDGLLPLSLRQINWTVDKLHERQFFARARANERQTFYSHRLNQEQLEARIIQGKTYSEDFHQRRRERQTAFMEQVQEQKAIKVNGAIKVNTDRNLDL